MRAEVERLDALSVRHASGHHEDAAFEGKLLLVGKKLKATLLSEIVIQQNDIESECDAGSRGPQSPRRNGPSSRGPARLQTTGSALLERACDRPPAGS
jgi:hypothetical protein